MTVVTLKRDNSWAVELSTPLQGPNGEITVLTIKPLSLDQIVRWGREEIPSQLALLSEMCGVQERLLKMLVAPDIDRVLMAFSAILPQSVMNSIRDRNAPLATAEEQLGMPEPGAIPDQQDPRFPHVEGEIRRFPEPPQFRPPTVNPPAAKPAVDEIGVDVNMPTTMRPVAGNA
jgi:hypothetical protein